MINLLNNEQHNISLGDAALYSLVAIALVFLILLILIGATYLIFKLLRIRDEKNPLKNKKNTAKVIEDKKENLLINVDYNDEDLVAGIIACSIDYRNEIKKDVKVVKIVMIK